MRAAIVLVDAMSTENVKKVTDDAAAEDKNVRQAVCGENGIDESDELLLEFQQIDFDYIDEEAMRLKYRFSQIAPEPAPVGGSESEEEDGYLRNSRSISFVQVEEDDLNIPRPFSTDLFPSTSEIDNLVNGQILMEQQEGKNLF